MCLKKIAGNEQWRFFELARKYYGVRRDESGIFCDIGANIGTTCIYFKKNIVPAISILAFELVQENYSLLRLNMTLNNISEKEAVLANMGVADRKGECNISFSENNPGGSSFLNVDEAGEKVQITPFEDYL